MCVATVASHIRSRASSVTPAARGSPPRVAGHRFANSGSRHVAAVGELEVDEGAVRALRAGKSLLPAGSCADRAIDRGDTVVVRDAAGLEWPGSGRLLEHAAQRIRGRRSQELEALLGFRGRAEMIPSRRPGADVTLIPIVRQVIATVSQRSRTSRPSARDRSRAVDAPMPLARATAATKNRALTVPAQAVRRRQAEILSANAEDVSAARAAGLSAARGRPAACCDTPRVTSIADGLEEVARLDDPVGAVMPPGRGRMVCESSAAGPWA